MSSESPFLKTLQDDVMAAFDLYYGNDTPFNRRIVVRVFASAVEGEVYHLKQHCLRRLDSDPAFYTAGEVAILRENAYSLGGDGSVMTRPQFFSAPENFHFALRAYAKDTLPSLDVTTDADGWRNFKHAFHVRNRVTHPKKDEDLIITDKDIGCVQRAFLWYLKTLRRTLVLSALALDSKHDELRDKLKKYDADPGPSTGPGIIPHDILIQWATQIERTEIPP